MTKPKGMEHHIRDFAVGKIKHSTIVALQKQYSQMTIEMVKDPENATNTMMGYLLLLALKNGMPKFPEIENQVLNDYKIINKGRRRK